ANSGLSDDEIERMVKDAEAHAEEDKKAHELVNARNQLDTLVHSVKKALAEHGDKIDGDEKGKIEAAIKDAEEAIKSGDKAAIDAKSEALAKVSQSLGEKVYAQAQAEAEAQGTGTSAGSSKTDDADVVDAEFTEVKDQK
ncbi:MAG: Hsp70 family protein, partial [Rhodocyclaceae bacterium]|nr:Hsp70 family protein [Rhodocyclaceae bacterium]